MSADSITEDKLSQKMILNIVKIQRLGKGLKKIKSFVAQLETNHPLKN